MRDTSQNPGERELCRGAVLGRGMRLQLLHQREIAAQIIALKPRHVAPCVACPQLRDIADLASQETEAERAVGDKADARLLTERQDLGFDVAGPQRILDLHGAERVIELLGAQWLVDCSACVPRYFLRALI